MRSEGSCGWHRGVCLIPADALQVMETFSPQLSPSLGYCRNSLQGWSRQKVKRG